MASSSKLTVESLTKLGATRLAEILIEEAGRNRQLKQAVQIALAAETGSFEVGHQIRKRLAQLARSEAFLSSEKARELASELDRLKSAIVETVGAGNPELAAELLWQLLDLHGAVFERLDDSSGRVGSLFRSACQDLGPLLKRSKSKPDELAPMVLRRITDNGYGIYDGIVFALNDALGREGRNILRRLLEGCRQAHLVSEKRAAVRPGHFDYTLSGLLSALRDIADGENDVDAFIDTYEGFDLTNPAYATEIARHLLRAGRAEKALHYLDQGAPNDRNRHFKELEWTDVRIGVLDALGRKDDAQALRLSLFKGHLSAPHLKAYLKQFADFDDVEAEKIALAQVERHGNVHAGLAFLINWPALDRAARVVEARIDEINGDLYELLDPAASALGEVSAGLRAAAPTPHRFHTAERTLYALPARGAPRAGNREPAVRHQGLRAAREPRRVHGPTEARAPAQAGVLVIARGVIAAALQLLMQSAGGFDSTNVSE